MSWIDDLLPHRPEALDLTIRFSQVEATIDRPEAASSPSRRAPFRSPLSDGAHQSAHRIDACGLKVNHSIEAAGSESSLSESGVGWAPSVLNNPATTPAARYSLRERCTALCRPAGSPVPSPRSERGPPCAFPARLRDPDGRWSRSRGRSNRPPPQLAGPSFRRQYPRREDVSSRCRAVTVNDTQPGPVADVRSS